MEKWQLSFINSRYRFDLDIKKELDCSTESWRFEKAAGGYANKGSYHLALKTWDEDEQLRVVENQSIDKIALSSSYQAWDAKEYILSRSVGYQIIIFNEAHHFPKNRVFVRQLLPELKKQGFESIGFETLNPLDDLINQRKYPIISSGTYSSEPQFGNLIRDALKLGFFVFPYESNTTLGVKTREIEQAINIKKYLDKNPKSKIIIYCGYAHAYKGELNFWDKAMAGYLMEYTGIVPLSIDQQVYRERSAKSYEPLIYRDQNVSVPTVFVDVLGNSFKLLKYPDSVDIIVFQDRTRYINNRPHWIFCKDYKEVKIDISSINMDYPIMVGAIKSDEDIEKAIPMDLYELKEKSTNAY